MMLDASNIDQERNNLVSCLLDSGLFELRDCRDLLVLEFTESEDSVTEIRTPVRKSRVRRPRRRSSTRSSTTDDHNSEIKRQDEKYRKKKGPRSPIGAWPHCSKIDKYEKPTKKEGPRSPIRAWPHCSKIDKYEKQTKREGTRSPLRAWPRSKIDRHEKQTKRERTKSPVRAWSHCSEIDSHEMQTKRGAHKFLQVGSPRSRSCSCTSADDRSSESDSISKKRKRVHNVHDTTDLPCMHSEMERGDCCKRQKIKIVEKTYEDTASDIISSSSSSQSSIKMYSFPPSQQYNGTTMKEESVQATQELFGYYFCDVCKIELSSEKVYHDHMNGKRHLKALKLKDVPKALLLTIPPSAATEGQSRYPKPPKEIKRKKVKERAKIQNIIRKEVKKPCPGLHLVTEIQGLKETIYYCKVCNSTCSANSIIPHLTGFKHQLTLVKHFKPVSYEEFSIERKNFIYGTVLSILKAIEKREGMGRMAVERDELKISKDMPFDVYKPSTSRVMPKTDLRHSGMTFTEYYDKATIPVKSAPDYYCRHCDAHMNAEDVWKAHIIGKRHIANLKKMPGELPSKLKSIPIPYVRATILTRIEKECPDEPIVGLNDIREIRSKDASESYRCFLCSSSHTSLDIIEHLVSLKHRKNYLDHMQCAYKYNISGLGGMSKSEIRNISKKMEAKYGCGKPDVHFDKNSFHL